MASIVDRANAAFLKLIPEIKATESLSLNESDVRFRIIDKLLTQVLGWPAGCIHTEAPTEAGYADYLLSDAAGKGRLVIEAKRAGALAAASTSPGVSTPKISGPVVKPLLPGVQQAISYATARGVPFAVVTDGTSWFFFKGSRSDGTAPLDASGILFPSFQAISDNFGQFYELASNHGVASRQNSLWLNRAEGNLATPEESQSFVRPATQAKFHETDALARDARLLFQQFFTRLANDSNKEMLRECFAETKESQTAEFGLRKIVEKLTNTATVIESARSEALQEEVERTIATGRSETALIVGNKGAGKSTFIDRFFEFILAPELRQQCVVARVDLQGFTAADKADVLPWALKQLRDQLEAAVTTNDPPTYQDLQGIFFDTYERWRVGPYKFLYDRSKDEFREKFGEHIESVRHSDPEQYTKLLMWRAFHGIKKLPCLVFDNTDQFDAEIQDKIYQLAHALGTAAPSLSIVPITDRSVWRFHKTGAMQSYPATIFYLPPPEVKQVLAKRITFVKEKLALPQEAALNYFSKMGFRVGLESLNLFAEAIEKVFVQTDFVSKAIGQLANHNIRRMLVLAERIFLSPQLTIDDMLKSAFKGEAITEDAARTHRAILLGQYDRYVEDDNEYVLNMFWTNPKNPSSPLLAYYILFVLKRNFTNPSLNLDDRYWPVADLVAYFEVAGCDRDACIVLLNRLFRWGLVEDIDPTSNHISDTSRVSLRDAGEAHLDLVLHSDTYVHEMALTTGLNSSKVLEDIRREEGKGAAGSFFGVNEQFLDYALKLDEARITIPSSKEHKPLSESRKRLDALINAMRTEKKKSEQAERIARRNAAPRGPRPQR